MHTMVNSEPRTSNFGKWMALTAALLGWLFDGLEMGLFPLIQKPALDELVGSGQRTLWMGIMTSFFLIGAATGGVLFGWLGDRIGRVRSMMLSVLTYAVVSGLCGFATNAWQIGLLRFVAALGMGGEWSLGVALINEIWPDRSRAFLAGLIGAAANVGYLLIGLVGYWVFQQIGQVHNALVAIGLSEAWATHLTKNEGWRFLMMLGAVPALLTFFIRWYVPESAKWEKERGKGATSHWATKDLFSVLIGAIAACLIIVLWAVRWDQYFAETSPVCDDAGVGVLGEIVRNIQAESRAPWIMSFQIVGSLVCFAVVTWGYTYPVLCYLKRAHAAGLVGGGDWKPTLKRMLLAATLSGVALLGTWGTIQQAPAWSGMLVEEGRKGLAPDSLAPAPPAKEWTQIASALGAVLGTIAAALLGGWLGRRITYFFLCIASFLIIQLFFQTSTVFDTKFLILGFLTGAITASFYGWLPLYLPELFPTAIRATGQGFGFNFGRILAAIGVLQLQTLQDAVGGLPQACAALSFIYVVGIIVIWFVPETKGQPLPD
jgi:SHS family sialic acid transporter-like MFS transporter